MPGEGQVLNVGKQPVTHGFDQGFGSPGVVYAEGVLAGHLKNGNNQNGQRHDPKVLSQIGKTADGIYGIHHKGGIVRLLAAQCAVHRCTNDLRLEHICQGGYTGRQNGNQKIPFCTFHKLPQKGELFPALWILFFWFHRFSPFLYVGLHGGSVRQILGLQNAKRAQAEACALKRLDDKKSTGKYTRSETFSVCCFELNDIQHETHSFLFGIFCIIALLR